MIVEQRMYTLYPGKTAAYLKLYEAEGLPLQGPIFGNMLGYFSTEFGELNLIVNLWGFDDFAERKRRRAELHALPEWQAYSARILPLIVRQENRILMPASFSPIR